VKRNYFIIIFALLISLFIYLFYRTENTVVTDIFISIISHDCFDLLRNRIITAFPLNSYVINSLPEGLWVFCITITSKNLYLKVANKEIYLLFIPLVFSIGLEFFQLLNITNGRFDFWDIVVSIIFWAIANYFIKVHYIKQNIINPITTRSLICIVSYLIVYLAHVWK